MKFMKKTFIFGGIVTAVGIILIIIGLGLHGNQHLDKVLQNEYNKGYHIEKYSKSLNSQRINDIKINSALPVNIKPGDQFKVDVNSDRRNIIQTNVKHNQLLINSQLVQSNTYLHEFFNKFKLAGAGYPNGSYINIIVPKQNLLSTIHQYKNIGNIKINNIKSKNISLNSSTGDIQLNNIDSVHPIALYSNSGDIRLSKIDSPSLLVNNNVGDIDIMHSKFDKLKSNINNNAGDIKLDTNIWNEVNGHNENGNVKFNQQFIRNTFKFDNDLGDINGNIHPEKDIIIQTNNRSNNSKIYSHNNNIYRNNIRNYKNYILNNKYGNINISK